MIRLDFKRCSINNRYRNFGLVKDEYILFYSGAKKSSDVFEEEKKRIWKIFLINRKDV